MLTVVIVACLAAIAVDAAPGFDGPVPCANPWKPLNNPCQGSNTQVYFPHPFDVSMFLQCDGLGRMFIIQCPAGEVYDHTTTACRAIHTNPVNPTGLFARCTAQNMATKRIYFPIANDIHHFIECTGVGVGTISSCPLNMVWNPSLVSCALPTATPVSTPFKNPCCTSEAPAGKLYFPGPTPHQYVQCNTNCHMFINDCPPELIWNNHKETCYAPSIHAVG